MSSTFNRREFLVRTGQAGVGLSALALLESVGLSSPASAATTVTVWDAPQSIHDITYFNTKLKNFEKSNPGIDVSYTSTPWATWSPTYTAAYKGSSPPDVAYMPSDFFTQFAGPGAFSKPGPRRRPQPRAVEDPLPRINLGRDAAQGHSVRAAVD